jgi:orotidine-5'-phosphate decarboxylase
VALDYPDAAQALAMASRLDPALCRLKVGKELFTAAGPELVSVLSGLGFGVFLDLKFHDIPNTVAGAIRAAAALGVWMVNVHASGGRRMMQAARDALGPAGPGVPLLTAVTVLTSMDATDLSETGVGGALEEQVLRLASLAVASGLDGVVCSAREAPVLRQALGATPVLVTPGIRPAGSDSGDQRRTLGPREALLAGSDFLVVGRPITAAADPAAAARDVLSEMSYRNPP